MKVIHAFVLGTLAGSLVAIGVVTAAEPEADPVKLSPQLYHVRFENDRVRVLEYRLAPGQKEPMHSHPPGIVYVLSEAKFRTIAADGSTSDSTSAVGEVHWRDFTTHAAENIGGTEAHALAVELKSCS
jgi:beta-alanine degradation protein BauB